LIEYAKSNALEFAIDVSTLKDAIISENLDAKYLLMQDEIANSVQKAADTYLFDAKILIHITDEDKIEALASEGIDGAILPEAIVKIS
jgi:hypothetical protein